MPCHPDGYDAGIKYDYIKYDYDEAVLDVSQTIVLDADGNVVEVLDGDVKEVEAKQTITIEWQRQGYKTPAEYLKAMHDSANALQYEIAKRYKPLVARIEDAQDYWNTEFLK